MTHEGTMTTLPLQIAPSDTPPCRSARKVWKASSVSAIASRTVVGRLADGTQDETLVIA
jgi:hypothetical protein